MAATGTSEELDCTTAPTVGRLAEPPEVTVVVRMECDGVTLTTVVTEKAVGVAEADALCLEEVEAVEEAGGHWDGDEDWVESSPGKKSAAGSLVGRG